MPLCGTTEDENRNSPFEGGSCEEIAVATVCDRRSPLSSTCGPALMERRYNSFTPSGCRGMSQRYAQDTPRSPGLLPSLQGGFSLEYKRSIHNQTLATRPDVAMLLSRGAR
jgi:hypothetical protein